ncbi:MAG: type IX secretion system sortase PorU, partial [Candidatus Eisenbacteria bacterium]|nr:type IX secretion system sortase PorU [Candidatus Latescibacterota bacterium]MBD3302852.1 type IX secretion system sortase PorU [Candidatus Eisenbacteria bacterium]
PPSLEVAGLASQPAANGWQLPHWTGWIGIPPGAEVTLATGAADRIPLRSRLDGAERIPVASDGGPSVRLGEPTWMRNQRVVSLTWSPLVFEAGTASWERSLRVEVRFDPAGETRGVGGGDRWEGLYRDLLLNDKAARAWRRSGVPRHKLQGDYFSTTGNPWFRIEVPAHDLYAITGSDLQAAGLDLDAIDDPARLRLFTGRGTSLPERSTVLELPEWLDEVAIRVEGGEDGRFDPQDRILFRGLGPDGWYAEFGLPDALYERYRTAQYSNVNTYWLSWGDFEGSPRRWERIDGTVPQGAARATAPHRVHYEENQFYDPHPWENYPGSLYQVADSLPAWEKWFWLEVVATASGRRVSADFVLPDPADDPTGELLVRMWGATGSSGSVYPDHLIRVDVSGDSVGSGSWERRNHFDLRVGGLTFTDVENEIGLTAPYVVDTLGRRDDRSYFAWFEVDYERRLIYRNEPMDFLVEAGAERIGFEIEGFTDAADTAGVIVLETTDPLRTKRVEAVFEPDGSGFVLRFGIDADPAREGRVLVADLDQAVKPMIVRDEPPGASYLRERSAAVDYIVIVPDRAYAAAARLAAWREDHGPDGEGMRTAVVRLQDVYDEFSAGRVDPVAIRNFLHYASLFWTGGDPAAGPSYVCLMGDASYDFRNWRGQRIDLFLPAYENFFVANLISTPYSPQFASDDFYVLFEGAADPAMDMAIGRLPADTPAAAEAVVDKVIAYESGQAQGDWRTRFTLIADDVCQGFSPDYPLLFTHTRQTEDLADATIPTELQRDRVYLYEFGAECVYSRKPDAAAALRRSIEEGTLAINYTGHGSEEQLADERVLETPDVAGMTNADRLFFFLTASCSVGKFNFAGTGLGEALVRHPGGGAIAVFSATSIAFSGTNALLNREVFEAVFPDRDATRSQPLGLASILAKQRVSRPADVGNRRYPLLGEPVVALWTPSRRVELEVEGIGERGASPDTIYRGGIARIRGRVVDAEGELQESFDGSVTLRVFDSEIVRQESVQFSSVEYNLNGAPIFRGNASVRGGRFEAELLAPAALRTGLRGDALLYAYAETEGGDGALGSRVGLTVPEIPPVGSGDADGPAIRLAVEGDRESLPPSAAWSATLTDSSGINITQLVPSRSVLLRIEEGSRLVHLEDLAGRVVFPESYRTGELEFTLPEDLESGRRYRLTLEASDNLDHRASTSTEFVLAGGEADRFTLGRVYNVPNPLDRETTFFVETNRTSDLTLQIFTATGRPIRTIRRSGISAVEAGQEGIRWDGRDEEGDRPANGVYFYKVTARAEDGKSRERIERLVVLR